MSLSLNQIFESNIFEFETEMHEDITAQKGETTSEMGVGQACYTYLGTKDINTIVIDINTIVISNVMIMGFEEQLCSILNGDDTSQEHRKVLNLDQPVKNNLFHET